MFCYFLGENTPCVSEAFMSNHCIQNFHRYDLDGQFSITASLVHCNFFCCILFFDIFIFCKNE